MRWNLIILMTAALAGCSEETTKVIEPSPVHGIEFHEPVSAAVEDENIRLTLYASLPVSGGGVFLSCEFENIGSQAIRYVDGGCGCPVPTPVMRDKQGEWCPWLGPRPLCPCEIVTVEVFPGQGGGHYSPRGCREGTASALFTYSVFSDNEWREHTIEVELPVEEPAN